MFLKKKKTYNLLLIKKILICSILIYYSPIINADFKQYQAKQLENLKSFQKIEKQAINKYHSLFSEYLTKQWKSFKVYNKKLGFKFPKVKNPPIMKQQNPNKLIDLPRVKSAMPIKIKQKSINKNKNFIQVRFDYFGNQIKLIAPNSLTINQQSTYNEKFFASLWDYFDTINWQTSIKQIKSIKKQAINDWFILNIVYKFADKLCDNENNTNLITWYLMNKLGYDIKIAYNKQQTKLFYSSKQKILDTRFLKLLSGIYYSFSDLKLNNIKTYNISFGKNQLDFNFKKPLIMPSKIENKQLKFNFANIQYKLDVAINLNNIKFLNSLPLLEMNWFAQNYSLTSGYINLIEILKPITTKIKNKPNFLLKFVQSLTYETDNNQFGQEKYLFPEQTMFYNSDCEDRSILYVYLINDLTKNKSILLHYPGHIATAITYNKSNGKYYIYKGQKYLVADPTYIGSNLGMEMPKMKKFNPQIIEVRL